MHNRLSEWKENLILSEDDKRQGYWMLDDTHFTRPLTPLFASFMMPAVTAGTQRAFDKMKMPLLQFVVKSDHGYYYQMTPPHPEPFEERAIQHQKKMESLFPQIKTYMEQKVNEFYMPFYDKLVERSTGQLSLSDALRYVEELRQFYAKAWQYHFEISFPRTSLAIALEAIYGQATGAEDTKGVYDLLQGIMNMSLETDRGLWLLANQVKASENLRTALETAEHPIDSLKQTAEGREFIKELQDFLSIYGHRTSVTHEFAEETWFENPSYALSIIKNYAQKDFDFDTAFKQVVDERKAKAKALFERLPEGELTDRFKTMYDWALSCWGADEDHHFYIDTMIAAKSRYFLKNVGRALVRERMIAHEEDIFFLYLDDLMEALQEPRPLQEAVERNKERHQAYRNRRPEPFYGLPPNVPPDPVIERIFGLSLGAKSDRQKSIKGYAASAGIYTGKVKVLCGQEDFAKLSKGDVLVCKSLTPPWTVLFPLAGALVTDAGGILSHAAIVAREYRLPAVVGTRTATSLLKDGDEVTVDGTNGIVTFVSRQDY